MQDLRILIGFSTHPRSLNVKRNLILNFYAWLSSAFRFLIWGKEVGSCLFESKFETDFVFFSFLVLVLGRGDTF